MKKAPISVTHPEIAAQLKDRSLGDVLTHGSSKKVWWMCDRKHEWEAAVFSRTGARSNGCPYCAGKRAIPGETDLGTLRPDVACELKDQSLASQLTLSSGRKVWWVCDLGHEWEARVVDRTGLGHGCPSCTQYGFDQTKPAFIYLVAQPALHDEDAVIVKLGIANASRLEARLKEHARQGLTQVLSTQGYLFGHKALEKERDFKKYLKALPAKYRVTKDELPDGYTEAFLSTAPDWQDHAA